MKFNRDFKGRGGEARDPRLPPGQYDIGSNWPVLGAEATPNLATSEWTFAIEGLVGNPVTWTWDEIHALESATYEGDIHCVTTWSKFGVSFGGVSVDTLLACAVPLPSASHVVAYSHTGYTTNLPLGDITDGKAWVVWEYERRPLEVGHGGPARLLVPHLAVGRLRRSSKSRPRQSARRPSASRSPKPRGTLPASITWFA